MKIISKDFHKYDSNWWDKLYTSHTHQESDTERSNHLDAQKIIGNGSVIDFGCGHGYFSKYVTGDYLGVDWSPEGIRKAKEMNQNRKFVVADVLTFNSDRQYDYAVGFEIFEHLEDPKKLVDNMLKHAPVAIFAFPKEEKSEETANNDAGLLNNIGIHDHHYHYANYYKEDILKMFPNAEIIEKDIDFFVIVTR